jgi:tRNA(fMet)-specific endonuclease VapC
MYLLDTNVWIVYLRGKSESVKQQLAKHASAEIYLCSVVLAELLFGAMKSAKPVQNRSAVDAAIAPYACLPFDQNAAERFAEIRWRLESIGTSIGPYDLQIAAIALANQCTLVTHNISEFQRVPGLIVEDWQG